MKRSVAVVGAGPAGSYSAYLLAEKGFCVNVFEEHSRVGRPVQCTGITTSILRSIIKERGFVINEIRKARVIAPDKSFVDVHFKKPNLVLDREGLDRHLMAMAKKAGASFHLGHSFRGFHNAGNKKKILLYNNRKKVESSADILIGADGPGSPVAKSAGLFGKRHFFLGLQKRVKLKNDNTVEFYPMKRSFAWVVPESKWIARVGAAAPPSLARNIFQSFVSNRLGQGFEDLETNAGLIPIFDPLVKTQKGAVFLVGDSATMVKATSGGGIVQGLMAAEELCKSISLRLNYDVEWRKRIGLELLVSLWARKLIDCFDASNYNRLIKLCNQEKLRKVLGKYERDKPTLLGLRLLAAEPRIVGEVLRGLF